MGTWDILAEALGLEEADRLGHEPAWDEEQVRSKVDSMLGLARGLPYNIEQRDWEQVVSAASYILNIAQVLSDPGGIAGQGADLDKYMGKYDPETDLDYDL